MLNLRKILFPVDFSEACAAMAPAVDEMARRFGASVIVLHAFNALPGYIADLPTSFLPARKALLFLTRPPP